MNDLTRDALRKAAVLEIALLSQRVGGLEPDVRENLVDRAAKAFEQAVDQEMDDIRKDVVVLRHREGHASPVVIGEGDGAWIATSGLEATIGPKKQPCQRPVGKRPDPASAVPEGTQKPLAALFYKDEGDGIGGARLFRCRVCEKGWRQIGWTLAEGPTHHETCPVLALSRGEAALRSEIARLTTELKVTDELLATRQVLMDAIPACPAHGSCCVPHAINWIKASIALSSRGAID